MMAVKNISIENCAIGTDVEGGSKISTPQVRLVVDNDRCGLDLE